MRSFRAQSLVFFISLKLLFDFFVPLRSVGFAVCMCAAGILLFLFRGVPLTARGLMASLASVCLIATQIFNSSDLEIFSKLMALPLLAIIFYGYGLRMSGSELDRAFRVIIVVFILLFICNFLVSYASGLLETRDFWAFEHRNLLGSYILVMIVPATFCSVWAPRSFRVTCLKFGILGAAFLSTSTGALLLTGLLFVRLRTISISSISRLVVRLVSLSCAGILILYFISPVAYSKLMAPIFLIVGGGWSELVNLATAGKGILHLNDTDQGSFTWRIYAYLVYGLFLMKEHVNELLWGNGIGGFKDVWDGIMPHNDLILIMVDFGLVPFSLLLFTWIKLVRACLLRHIQWLPVVFALTGRLMFENNIYTFYVLSNVVIFSSLIFGLRRGSRIDSVALNHQLRAAGSRMDNAKGA
jgi:hypothetical protein